MWFKLASATFTTHLGSMASLSNSISIKYNASGFSYTTGTVSKDASSASLTLTLNNNWTYEHNNSNVTITGATKGTTSYSNGTLTIPITPSSGSTFGASEVSSINVTVTGAVSSGGKPEAPTNYTFTITPDPISATVTLSATGYSTVSGTGSKSITVANGTTVNWSVSADGYTTRTGNWTISGGNKTENITLTASDGTNIAYYVVNKNIWSDGELTSGSGRIAITTYFPTDGKELSVSTSISEVSTIAKRYYNTEKVGGVDATESTYGRPVLVLGTTALEDIYAGQTITVNGTVYTLQADPTYLPKHVTYKTQASIGADGELVENYSEFRVSILDYFETGGKKLTTACSLGGTAVRYYDANKVGGITDPAQSVYGRVVIHSIAAENQNDAAVEGASLIVNGESYILSNN